MQRDPRVSEWIAAMSASIHDRVNQSINQSISENASLVNTPRAIKRVSNLSLNQSSNSVKLSRHHSINHSPNQSIDWCDDGYFDDGQDNFMTHHYHQSNNQSIKQTSTFHPFALCRSHSAPVDDSDIDESIDRLHNDAIRQSIKRSIRSISESDHTINQSVNESINQHIHTSLSVDAGDSGLIARSLIDQSFYQLLEQIPVIRSNNQSNNQTSDRSDSRCSQVVPIEKAEESSPSVNRSIKQLNNQSTDNNDDDFYDRDDCRCEICLYDRFTMDQSINHSVNTFDESMNNLSLRSLVDLSINQSNNETSNQSNYKLSVVRPLGLDPIIEDIDSDDSPINQSNNQSNNQTVNQSPVLTSPDTESDHSIWSSSPVNQSSDSSSDSTRNQPIKRAVSHSNDGQSNNQTNERHVRKHQRANSKRLFNQSNNQTVR